MDEAERALIRASKAAAAALTQLHGYLGHVGATLGELVALVDNQRNAPAEGSQFYLDVDKLTGQLGDAYTALVDRVQAEFNPAPDGGET